MPCYSISGCIQLACGGSGSGAAARPSTWDTFAILDALALYDVDSTVCDAVGEVAIDVHDDAVPLHCLGSVMLRGGVPPAVALRAVNQLVQVRCCSFPSPASPPVHTRVVRNATFCVVRSAAVRMCMCACVCACWPLQPMPPPPGSLLAVTLLDVLCARDVDEGAIHSAATTLLSPSGNGKVPPPPGHDPCTVSEGAVVKLLCSVGLKPTAASAVRKALAQAAAVRGHHGVVFFPPASFVVAPLPLPAWCAPCFTCFFWRAELGGRLVGICLFVHPVMHNRLWLLPRMWFV